MLEMSLMNGGVRIDPHGAKLQTHEAFPEGADALLTEKGGAGRNQFDKDGDEQAQGRKHGKGQHNAGDIKDPFPQWEWIMDGNGQRVLPVFPHGIIINAD
jgi:hypothetical protein